MLCSMQVYNLKYRKEYRVQSNTHTHKSIVTHKGATLHNTISILYLIPQLCTVTPYMPQGTFIHTRTQTNKIQ